MVVLNAFIEQAPRLHAERQMELAQIAMYPHLKENSERSALWRMWQQRAWPKAGLDRMGNTILRGGQAVREWLGRFGMRS